MRAMIKSNLAGGFSILLVPENSVEKYRLERKLGSLSRMNIVRALITDGELNAGNGTIRTFPDNESHITLVGEADQPQR